MLEFEKVHFFLFVKAAEREATRRRRIRRVLQAEARGGEAHPRHALGFTGESIFLLLIYFFNLFFCFYIASMNEILFAFLPITCPTLPFPRFRLRCV
jgi:hypothetical protein